MSKQHADRSKSFGSKWGFILASVGSAVGMANVWGFPNKLGSNGGGAFLFVYLFFVIVFSYVGLPSEFAIGRRAGTGTLGAYQYAWATRSEKAGKVGGVLAWLPLAGSLCIAIGYAIIIAYILKAFVDSLFGDLMTVDTAMWFEGFSMTSYSVIPYPVSYTHLQTAGFCCDCRDHRSIHSRNRKALTAQVCAVLFYEVGLIAERYFRNNDKGTAAQTGCSLRAAVSCFSICY